MMVAMELHLETGNLIYIESLIKIRLERILINTQVICPLPLKNK